MNASCLTKGENTGKPRIFSGPAGQVDSRVRS